MLILYLYERIFLVKIKLKTKTKQNRLYYTLTWTVIYMLIHHVSFLQK